MASGQDVYEEIGRAVERVSGDHERLSKKVNECESQIDTLNADRENVYASLAATYLPELDAQAIQSTLKEVQQDVQAIFKKKQIRRKQLEELMTTTTGQKNAASATLDLVTKQLSEKASEREGVKAKIMRYLEENNEYISLKSNAEQAKKVLEQNNQRLEEAKQESGQKLPAYEANKLFLYLARKYRTDDAIKGLDAWVARLVGFKEQKQNYDFLRSMPQLMRIEVERRQQEYTEKASKLQTFDKKVADEYGLTKILEDGEAIAAKRKELQQKIQQLDVEYNSYSRERTKSDSAKDSYHKEAVAKLKSFLESDSLVDLKKKARETQGTEDDRLVGRLEESETQINGLKAAAKKLKSERDEIGKKLSELNDIKSRYSSSDYESHRSYFDDNLDAGALITGYLAGKYAHDHVWSELEQNHHFRPVQTYSSHDDDDSSSSIGFGSISSGSFGGGSHASSGGFGGGGHSSSGGF